MSSTKTSVDVFQLRTLSYSTSMARPKTAGSVKSQHSLLKWPRELKIDSRSKLSASQAAWRRGAEGVGGLRGGGGGDPALFGSFKPIAPATTATCLVTPSADTRYVLIGSLEMYLPLHHHLISTCTRQIILSSPQHTCLTPALPRLLPTHQYGCPFSSILLIKSKHAVICTPCL